MKTLLMFNILLYTYIVQGLPRAKRDLTCASFGHDSCDISCKVRGWAGGECSWDQDTAAYNCNCSTERRGIRCNVGGPNTCKYTCKMIGHTGGTCDDQFNCNCSGENSRWGSVLQNIGNRL